MDDSLLGGLAALFRSAMDTVIQSDPNIECNTVGGQQPVVQQPAADSTGLLSLLLSPIVGEKQPTGCVEKDDILVSSSGIPLQLHSQTMASFSSIPGPEPQGRQSCTQPSLASPLLRSSTRRRVRSCSLSSLSSVVNSHIAGTDQIKSAVWACTICHKSCASKAGLASHARACLRKHGNTTPQKKGSPSYKTLRRKPRNNPFLRKFPCMSCSRVFSSRTSRDKHLKMCAPAPDPIVKVRKRLNNTQNQPKLDKRSCTPKKLAQEVIEEIVDNCPSLVKTYKKSKKLANVLVSESLGPEMAATEYFYDGVGHSNGEQESTHQKADTTIESEDTEYHISPQHQSPTLPEGTPSTFSKHPMCNPDTVDQLVDCTDQSSFSSEYPQTTPNSNMDGTNQTEFPSESPDSGGTDDILFISEQNTVSESGIPILPSHSTPVSEQGSTKADHINTSDEMNSQTCDKSVGEQPNLVPEGQSNSKAVPHPEWLPQQENKSRPCELGDDLLPEASLSEAMEDNTSNDSYTCTLDHTLTQSVTYKENLKYLDVYLASKHLVPLDIRGDGHCIPKAVSSCLKYASPTFPFVSSSHSPESLLKGIVKEVYDNQSRYTAFVESGIDVLLQIRKYAHQKDYMNRTASMVPNILANMLNLNINIVTQYLDRETKSPLPNFDVTVIGPGYATPVHNIYLLRTGTGEDAATHYQSLVRGKQLTNPLKPMHQDNWLPGEQKWKCTLTGQKYLLFRSPSDFSNFALVDNLVVMGKEYKSNEQNIQARRFPEKDEVRNQIMATSNSLSQKRLGDSGEKNVDKDFLHLLQGLIRKFSDNKKMKDKLLETKGFMLCEATHSYLWGIGRDIRNDPPNIISDRTKWKSDGIGLMSLGLMVVREELLVNSCADAESLIGILDHIFRLPGVPAGNLLGGSPSPSRDQENTEECSGGLDSVLPTRDVSAPLTHTAKASPRSDSGDASSDDVTGTENLHYGNQQQRVRAQFQNLELLAGQACYHPPTGMNAYETVDTVTKTRPDIGKFLLVNMGKITSIQPHICLALKQPLLPSHPVLGSPLKRVCPVNTHRTIWLTKPIPNMNSDKWCSMVANNPKVVAISVSQKDPSHSIFTITTAYVASQAVPIEKETPLLELSNGNIVKLIPSGPTRCTKCQELGHLKRTCPSTTWTCVHCAGEHPSMDCKNTSNLKCARCKQEHKSSSLKCKAYIEARVKANLPTLESTPDTVRAHPFSFHVTTGMDGHLHTEAQHYSSNPGQHKNTPLLTGHPLYHPPSGLDACETVAVVARFRPSIGKFLLAKKGKITTLNPDALLALKLPLLCHHPVLGIPLKPVYPSVVANENDNFPTMEFTPDTVSAHPPSFHVASGMDGHLHTEGQDYGSNPVQHEKTQLLTKHPLYHPPSGMDACETVAVVARFRPSIGKFLLVKKGKITALNPDTILALKRPLLCLHPMLGIPLKPVYPINNKHILTLPIQNKPVPRLMDIELPTHRLAQCTNIYNRLPFVISNPGSNSNNPIQRRGSRQRTTNATSKFTGTEFRAPQTQNTFYQEDHPPQWVPPAYQNHSNLHNTQMLYNVKLTYAQLVTFHETFPQWTTMSNPIYN